LRNARLLTPESARYPFFYSFSIFSISRGEQRLRLLSDPAQLLDLAFFMGTPFGHAPAILHFFADLEKTAPPAPPAQASVRRHFPAAAPCHRNW
jgi:hypothetical protein